MKHPSLWTFIRCLKDRQAVAETALDAAGHGEAPPSRRKKWRKLEAKLLRLKRQYNSGDRDLESYWDAVSHCIDYA